MGVWLFLFGCFSFLAHVFSFFCKHIFQFKYFFCLSFFVFYFNLHGWHFSCLLAFFLTSVLFVFGGSGVWCFSAFGSKSAWGILDNLKNISRLLFRLSGSGVRCGRFSSFTGKGVWGIAFLLACLLTSFWSLADQGFGVLSGKGACALACLFSCFLACLFWGLTNQGFGAEVLLCFSIFTDKGA